MIPIISRLRFIDYLRIVGCLAFLLLEFVLRIIMFIFPAPLVDWIRFKVIGKFPRAFRGFNDDEDLQNNPAFNMNARQIIESRGYDCEEHLVITSDGYFLVLFRVIKRESQGTKKTPKPAILCMHGFMMNCEVWICQPDPSKCLVWQLVENGYDVWLGNNRGNKYSSKHVNLQRGTKEFWNFGIDELALYDVPSMTSYIKKITALPSITYIGFSQGTAQCFAALSIHSSLHQDINLFVALASTTKPVGLENRYVSAMIGTSPEIIYLLFGRKVGLALALFWQNLMSRSATVWIYDLSMKHLFGWSMDNIDEKQKPILYSHLYSFASVKQVVHWFQIIRNQRFQMYDESDRLMSNGHVTPAFPLAQIKAPIAIFNGTRDTLPDLKYTLDNCPKPVFLKSYQGYEHLDFIWAKDLDKTVIPDVIELLKNRSGSGKKD